MALWGEWIDGRTLVKLIGWPHWFGKTWVVVVSFLLPPSFPLPFPFLSPSFFLPFSFLPPFLLFHPCPLTSSADSFSLSLFLSFPAGNWDGSGGTGAAKTHYEQLLRDTGKNYPLVVKLGTITPDGKGDVYSYAADEDDAVLNPQLKNHLIRLGIDVNILKKTEKSTAELQVSDKRDCLLFVVFSIGRRCNWLFCASLLTSLPPPSSLFSLFFYPFFPLQIELNLNYNFSAITEEGASLIPLHGPNFVGLANLGNTCYLNSTLQMLLSLDEVRAQYGSSSSSSSSSEDLTQHHAVSGAA